MEKLEVRLQKRMHVSLYALLFLTVLLGISILLEGCSDKCEETVHYTYYEPIYKTHDDLRNEVSLTTPQPLKAVGRIYRIGDLLFVNDPGNGIHIIDNSDPSNPVKKSFLKVPGNFNMAIKGNSLFADNYIDLVVFDITDLANIREVKRVENVFSNIYSYIDFAADNSRGIITGWEAKELMDIQRSDCIGSNHVEPFVALTDGIAFNDAAYSSKSEQRTANAPGIGSGPGVGGSMSQFTLADDHLYILYGGFLQPIDVTNPMAPSLDEKSYIAWDIETIFPYGENLFIGSSSGMHIYDISSPSTPQKVSTYEHIRSCDPVVVDRKYAYVTLRSGTECSGFTNQLEVIDIENLSEPRLVQTYAMTNPHGLGIDDGILFVCDGADGLKVFDASDVNKIPENLLAYYNNINAYDVIPWNDVLVMIGEDGLFQYDYSNPENIKLLSQIPVTNGE